MGRAIVREPQVFLMDEPLSNLDAKLRVQMRAEIGKLQHELATTTIYVTHDQVEAMTMGDRVAVMSMGVLQQVDTPQHLYDEPFNLFVAGFIGTPPMNLFEGTVHTNGGGVTVTIGSSTLPVAPVCLARYSGVTHADGLEVVVGIRAEDVHPASARPDMPTLDGRIELVEALGSGLMAHLHIDAQQVRPEGAEEVELPEEGDSAVVARPNLIAHFPPRLDLQHRRHDPDRPPLSVSRPVPAPPFRTLFASLPEIVSSRLPPVAFSISDRKSSLNNFALAMLPGAFCKSSSCAN